MFVFVFRMPGEIVLDIETQNTYDEVGANNTKALKVSLVGVYDYAHDAFRAFREAELTALWPLLENAERIIGFNSIYFDLPVLNNYYHADLTKFQQLDILVEIKKALGFRIKLDDVAQATLGVKKSGHGLQAVEWFKAGEWEKIEKYCLDDVRITRDIYEFGKKYAQLYYTDIKGLRAFPVNFTHTPLAGAHQSFEMRGSQTLPL